MPHKLKNPDLLLKSRVIKNIRGNKEEGTTLEILCSCPIVCPQNSSSFTMSKCDLTENTVFADVIKVKSY